MRGKQSVRKSFWYIVGRRKRKRRVIKRQREWGFPIGLLTSATASFLGEIAKPILKKVFSGRKRRQWDKTYRYDDVLHLKGFDYQTVQRF